ncbi:MAG: hypothetical protein NTY33_00995 [Candidatus Moranbacteria bacterium]|nr:hypothetical protein [Candidatus Moranbacteria bacterium]
MVPNYSSWPKPLFRWGFFHGVFATQVETGGLDLHFSANIPAPNPGGYAYWLIDANLEMGLSCTGYCIRVRTFAPATRSTSEFVAKAWLRVMQFCAFIGYVSHPTKIKHPVCGAGTKYPNAAC